MCKFILGEKGAGKTKWLIDNANKDMLEGNGNIAFVDVDHDHIFSLNYNVRLINAMEFNVDSVESSMAFVWNYWHGLRPGKDLCGLHL